MEWILLVLGVIPYAAMAYIMYDNERRNSNYCIPVIVALAAFAGWIWAVAARSINDSHLIYIYDVIWDAMITVVFIAVPIVFFSVRLSKFEIAGLVFVCLGLVLMKIHA